MDRQTDERRWLHYLPC